MSVPSIVEITVHLLYLVLAFTSVLVLLASTIGLFVFTTRLAARKIGSLMDTAVDAGSPGTEPYVKTLNPLGVAVERGARQIPGGHNERF